MRRPSCSSPLRRRHSQERLSKLRRRSSRRSLAQAILFLHKRTAELDPNPNPALRGVNLIAMPLAPGSAEPKITLNLEKTSLSDILRYVASQTHLQLDSESSAMVFRPKNRDHSAKGSIQN